MVRPATLDDLAAITRIENDAIQNTFAHFGTSPVIQEDTQRAFEFSQGRYPWVVAEIDGKVVGFARCGPWKTREAYRWTTEVGVYVESGHQGRGIGKNLYETLFPLIKEAGLKTVLAGIALPNEASVKLHEAMGMAHVGTLPRVGHKFGEWRDVGYWALNFV